MMILSYQNLKLTHLMDNSDMKKDSNQFDVSRRQFMKNTVVVTGAASLATFGSTNAMAFAINSSKPFSENPISQNLIGFNGERLDPITGYYHLGNGYRIYNPTIMRFHAADSMSPFEQGGINSYAYCLGDPVNRRDPSGHITILSLLIGAIVGSITGFIVAAVSEGIRVAITGEKFNWTQVGIATALGFVSGAFGVASEGAKFGVKMGLSIAESVSTSALEFGLNVAAGTPVNQAFANSAVGFLVGMFGFHSGNKSAKGYDALKCNSNQLTRKIQKFDDGRMGVPLSPVNAPQSSAIGAFARTVHHSLTSGNSVAQSIEPRQYIEQSLARNHLDSTFGNALYHVNRNLASHGDTNISVSSSRAYVSDALQTQTGELSNTAAHVNAAGRWISRGDGVGVAGFMFNMGGAFFSGAIDHSLHKTGRLLAKAEVPKTPSSM